MPLYEYECESCRKRIEKIQKFADPPIAECPSCGGPLKKLLSSPAIQFKGSGWYVTDYAKKSSSGSGKTGSAKADADTPADKKGDASTSTDSGSSSQDTKKD